MDAEELSRRHQRWGWASLALFALLGPTCADASATARQHTSACHMSRCERIGPGDGAGVGSDLADIN